MNKEQLMNNLYDIIAEHIDELDYKDGANIYLTDKNEIHIELNDSEQVFILNVKEKKINMKQLTMEKILNVALAMKQKGINLSEIKVYLGNDDELNGVHNAWYCELVENDGQENNDLIVDLINEDYNNNKVEKDEKFILIS